MSLDNAIEQKIASLKEYYGPALVSLIQEIIKRKKNLETGNFKEADENFKEEKINEIISKYINNLLRGLRISQELTELFGLKEEAGSAIMLKIFNNLEGYVKEISNDEIRHIDPKLLSHHKVVSKIRDDYDEDLSKKFNYFLPMLLEPIVLKLIDVRESTLPSKKEEPQINELLYQKRTEHILKRTESSITERMKLFEFDLEELSKSKGKSILFKDLNAFFESSFKQLLKEAYLEKNDEKIESDSSEPNNSLEELLTEMFLELAPRYFFTQEWISKNQFDKASKTILDLLLNEEFERALINKELPQRMVGGYNISPKNEFHIYEDSLIKLRNKYSIESNINNFKKFITGSVGLFMKQYKNYLLKEFKNFQESRGLLNSFTSYGNLIRNLSKSLDLRIKEHPGKWTRKLIDDLPRIITESLNDKTENTEAHDELVVFNDINKINLAKIIEGFLYSKGTSKSRVEKQTDAIFSKLEPLLKINQELEKEYATVKAMIKDYELIFNKLCAKKNVLLDSGLHLILENNTQKSIFNFLKGYEQIKLSDMGSKGIALSELLQDYQLGLLLLNKENQKRSIKEEEDFISEKTGYLSNLFDLMIYTDITDNSRLGSLTNDMKGSAPKLGTELKAWRNLDGKFIFLESLGDIKNAIKFLRKELLFKYKDNSLRIDSINFNPYLLESESDEQKDESKQKVRTIQYRSHLNNNHEILSQAIIVSNKELNGLEPSIEGMSNKIKEFYGLYFNDLEPLEDMLYELETTYIPLMTNQFTLDLFDKLYRQTDETIETNDKWIVKNMGELKMKLDRTVRCIDSMGQYGGEHEIKVNQLLSKKFAKDLIIKNVHELSNSRIRQNNEKIDREVVRIEEMISKGVESKTELEQKKEELLSSRINCPECSSEVLICPPKTAITGGYVLGEIEFINENPNFITELLEGCAYLGDSILNSLFITTNNIKDNTYRTDSTLPFLREVHYSVNDKEYLMIFGRPSQDDLNESEFKTQMFIFEKSDDGVKKEDIFKKANKYKNKDISQTIEMLKNYFGDNVVIANNNVKKEL